MFILIANIRRGESQAKRRYTLKRYQGMPFKMVYYRIKRNNDEDGLRKIRLGTNNEWNEKIYSLHVKQNFH